MFSYIDITGEVGWSHHATRLLQCRTEPVDISSVEPFYIRRMMLPVISWRSGIVLILIGSDKLEKYPHTHNESIHAYTQQDRVDSTDRYAISW